MKWKRNLFKRTREKKRSFIWKFQKQKYLLELASITSGLVILLGVAAFTMGAEKAGSSRVYAVGEDEAKLGVRGEIQAGLMGVVTGVASMEEYGQAAREKAVVTQNEEVIVGTSKIDKCAWNQMTIWKCVRKARNLGYYAQQAVVNNQQLSSLDYQTLLQIVEAEATGGDEKSKILIANVVMNRVKDSHFPDSIYEVVWEKAQFAPVSDGRIYSCTITESTIKAVDRALAGEDYSQGALFFLARNCAEQHNVEWFDASLVKLFDYGGHEYFTYPEYCQ